MKKKSYIRNISIAVLFFTAVKKVMDISFQAYKEMKKSHKESKKDGKEKDKN
jgi:type III secretory pathway component EscU